VKPFWHPLSTVLLDAPRCFATTTLVRMMLGAEGRVRMIYAGDRMWPALRHGAAFELIPLPSGPVARGTLVLAAPDGIPDLLRVAAADGESVRLVADSDPGSEWAASSAALLGTARLPIRASSRRRARLRRLTLDLQEAWRGRVDREENPAATVQDKYESQATHYARDASAMDPRLLERIRQRADAGGSLLVLGSGVGTECLTLAASGFRVTGVDFSPAMVRFAREEAQRRGVAIDFRLADVRTLAFPPGGFDALLFTYDVYSFLPSRADRVALLRRLATWLAQDGTIFLSARRLRSGYERLILSLQWLALQRGGFGEWGDSHTRWIPGDGSLRRSFVHVFTEGALREEAERAGFRIESWEGGHGILSRSPAP